MSDPVQIILETLPETQNFNQLKQLGVTYAQEISGHQWNNYNEVDPGVTILDQLCYALTELGYCIGFDIQDILTHADGKMQFDNQFIAPEDILTCSPVTPDDYRKLLLDDVDGLKGVYFVNNDSESVHKGIQDCQLLLDDEPFFKGHISNPVAVSSQVLQICNQHRNLCEVFQKPQVLGVETVNLVGRVYIAEYASSEKISSLIKLALANYICPDIKREGYAQLQDVLYSQDIFNGPKLKKGWIEDSQLQPKRSTLLLQEIVQLISQVEGVEYIDSLSLNSQTGKAIEASNGNTGIDIDSAKTAVIELGMGFQLLKPHSQQRQNYQQDSISFLAGIQKGGAATEIEAQVAPFPETPTGNFRDIENYYSIQNTFPDIYGVGGRTVVKDLPDFRVAQIRQLKGYLTLFDQLLANQFSQLAHLDKLFSFSNVSAANYLRKGDKEPNNYLAGLPYRSELATYFCQPLYEVPDIQPLLKGSSNFDSLQGGDNPLLRGEQAWRQYQQDPFNPYYYGLVHLLEDDDGCAQRRNNMLNHLLARHGYVAQEFDQIITLCQWYGSEDLTLAVVKSLWLINFQKLNYCKGKGYNIMEADKLPTPDELQDNYFKREKKKWIGEQGPEKPFIENESAFIQHLHSVPLQRDGKIDFQAIEAKYTLTRQDFTNYSCFELVQGLLLNLPAHYTLLIDNLVSLLNDSDFKSWLVAPSSNDTDKKKNAGEVNNSTRNNASEGDAKLIYYFEIKDLRVERVKQVGNRGHATIWVDKIIQGQKGQFQTELLTIQTSEGVQPTIDSYKSHLLQLYWLATHRKGLLLIEHILMWQKDTSINNKNWFQSQATLVFPGYVSIFRRLPIISMVKQLMLWFWPAHIQTHFCLASFADLQVVIQSFTNWHNSLPVKLYGQFKSNDESAMSNDTAESLYDALTTAIAGQAGGIHDY